MTIKIQIHCEEIEGLGLYLDTQLEEVSLRFQDFYLKVHKTYFLYWWIRLVDSGNHLASSKLEDLDKIFSPFSFN